MIAAIDSAAGGDVDEGAIPTSREVVIPPQFLHEGDHRFRSAGISCNGPPLVAQAIAGVAPFAGFVGCGDHFSKELGFVASALQCKGDGRHAVFTIIVMNGSRTVLTVRYRALADVVAEKLIRPRDGRLDFRNFDAALLGQHHRNETR